MSCVIRSRSGWLALRLRWTLPESGVHVESHEAVKVRDTKRAREIVERDFCRPINAEIRARRFSRERYLDWFPHGSKATRFRVELGIVETAGQKRDPVSLEEFAERWLKTIDAPFARRSRVRDYRQALTAYVIPYFGPKDLGSFGVQDLYDFRRYLTEERGLSAKTVKNVINANMRAMFRHARDEGVIASYDFFKAVSWAGFGSRSNPDPFTDDERERISEHYEQYRGGAFSAFVDLMLFAGLRPSEATGLRVGDFEQKTGRLQINRSRNLQEESTTKTGHSARTIKVASRVEVKLRKLAEGRDPARHLFLNLRGGPLNQDHWRKDHWHRCLVDLGIRDRVFYCCRHTFISLAASNGMPLIGLARYCGTSVQVIQQSYGRWMPRDDDEILRFVEGAKTGRSGGPVPFRTEKGLQEGTSPTGFELVTDRKANRHNLNQKRNYYGELQLVVGGCVDERRLR